MNDKEQTMKTEPSTKDSKLDSSDLENHQKELNTSETEPEKANGLTNSSPAPNGKSEPNSKASKKTSDSNGPFINPDDLDLTLTDDDDDDESSRPAVLDISVQSFDDLDLEPELHKVINDLGWTSPTPVQGKCLPHSIIGKDVAGFAQTGTGKTGVFLITLANTIKRAKDNQQTNGPKAIILVPTRELAVQIHADAEPIFAALKISSLAVYGGIDYEKQAQSIKQGVDVIVATPGRLKDYFQKRLFTLKYCNQFVCDEADRMFDMGFVEDIEFFLSKLTEKTQKLLFSATTNADVKELAFEYLENPEYISVNPEVMTPENIEQYAVMCESTEKLKVMLGMLREHQPPCSIIFTNTKIVAEWLHYKLKGNGIEADLITGDLPQRKRISLISRIKAGEIKALIATDVASRGLHITDISHVYNFDLPNEPSNYVHRIGRTARAGARGKSYSLVCEDYGQNLQDIKDYLGEHQATIEIAWFKDEYMQVQDLAGNPYRDPEFKSASGKSDGGQGGRKEQGRRPSSDRPMSNRNGKDARVETTARGPKSDRGRGRKGERRPEQENNQQHARGTSDRNRQRRSGPPPQFRKKKAATHQNRRPEQEQAARTKTSSEEAPASIGGIFKRIVGLMFGGRKSK